ncbi:MAG: aldehyde dehydrogenase family protein [Desulfovibrionaceae bacterium]
MAPWNFSISRIARKLSAPLAASRPVVFRPTSLWRRFRLVAGQKTLPRQPAGCTRPRDSKIIGGYLTSNKTVRKIDFTGSTAVGKLLLAETPATVKRMSMERGGDAPSSSSRTRTWRRRRPAACKAKPRRSDMEQRKGGRAARKFLNRNPGEELSKKRLPTRNDATLPAPSYSVTASAKD